MAAMSKWERVEAALAGEAVDRPPVSLWQHFPEQDQTAEALADVHARLAGAVRQRLHQVHAAGRLRDD